MLAFENKNNGTYFEITDADLVIVGKTANGTIYRDAIALNYYLLAEGASGDCETEAAVMLELGDERLITTDLIVNNLLTGSNT